MLPQTQLSQSITNMPAPEVAGRSQDPELASPHGVELGIRQAVGFPCCLPVCLSVCLSYNILLITN